MKTSWKTLICAAALAICAAAQGATSVDLESDAIHLYKFDGDLSNSATCADKSDLSISITGSAAYETLDETTSDKALLFSEGRAWGTGGMWTDGYSGTSFTFLLQLRSSGQEGKALFSYGTAESGAGHYTTCVGLYSGGTGIIDVKYMYNGAIQSSFSMAVDDAESAYHTYALVVVGDGTNPATTVYVYVDGKKRGTLTTNGTNAESKFCFGGVYAGGVDSTAGGVGDFRFFRSALTSDDIAEYHVIMGGTVDTNELPTHWYTFNGNLASSGREQLTFSGGTDGATYTTERKRTSLNISTTVAPSGSGLAYTSDRESAYTFICCGKMSATDNTALWMAGNDANQYGGYRMGVYKGTGNNVVFAYTWYAKDGDIMASPLATATVSDISSKFHTYAIVKKATKDSNNKYDFEFYVDGVSVGTSTQFFDTLTDVFQFGAGYGKDVYKADGAALDDWRMFSRELSAEEIRQYHERFREHTGFVIIISDATLEVPTTWGGVSGMEEETAAVALVAEYE